MNEDLRSIVLGTSLLTVAAIIALVLTAVRTPHADDPQRRRLTFIAAVAIAVQCAHFVEELSTGFYRSFPETFGLEPWSVRFFVTFNACWIAAWLLSLAGIRRGYRPAFFPIWFLAIGLTGNGVVHPLMALNAGGYVPGLVTAPIVGVAGGWLLVALIRATR